ncbi:MAG: peptidylprolyl isomerase, partial [Gemmatimonadetes bacterium]|nr:peptidylprolyl isomerase [Gemmatimonadota bacterium]
ANFIRIVEGNAGQASGGRFRRGRPDEARPAIGSIVEVGGGVVSAVIDSEAQRSAAVDNLPLGENPAVKHDGPGVLGISGANTFYLTLDAKPSLDGRYTALGKVIAGAHTLGDLAAGDGIQRVRILRSGEAALAFATDDDAFRQLMRRARQR